MSCVNLISMLLKTFNLLCMLCQHTCITFTHPINLTITFGLWLKTYVMRVGEKQRVIGLDEYTYIKKV